MSDVSYDEFHVKDLMRSNIGVVVLLLAGFTLNYALNVFLARVLSVAHYGDIAIVLQVLILAVPFVLLGTELSVMRYVPKYLAANETSKLSGFGRWARGVIGIASLVFMGVGVVLVTGFEMLQKIGYFSKETLHPVAFAFMLIPLFGFIMFQASTFRALKKYKLSMGAQLFYVIFLLACLALILLVFGHISMGHVLWSIGVACVFVAFLQFMLLRQTHLSKTIETVKPDLTEIKTWRQVSFKMMMSSLIFSGLASVDIIMLELLGANEKMVGLFAAALTVAGFIFVFSTAVVVIVGPLISPLVDKGKMAELQRLVNVTNLMKAVPLIVVLILLAIFGKAILSHFGPGYQSAYGPMMLLCGAYFIAACIGVYGALLMYSEYQGLTVIIGLIELGLVIGLNLVLIPHYGIYGAVWSFAISIILSGIIGMVLVRKKLGIRVLYIC